MPVIPRRLGRDVLERDVNRLKTITSDLASFTIPDPLRIKRLEIEDYDSTSLVASMFGYVNATGDRSLYMETEQPDDAGISFIQILADGDAPSGEYARIQLYSGDGAARESRILLGVEGDSDTVSIRRTRMRVDGHILTTGGLFVGAELVPDDATINLAERSSDPGNPAEGRSVLWQSDGTGSGDDGDIMMLITAGGSTKTATLVDFSAL